MDSVIFSLLTRWITDFVVFYFRFEMTSHTVCVRESKRGGPEKATWVLWLLATDP